MKQNQNVSLRAAQNLTTSKAAVTKKNLHDWFAEVFGELKSNQKEHLLKIPGKLFNVDESAFFLNPLWFWPERAIQMFTSSLVQMKKSV